VLDDAPIFAERRSEGRIWVKLPTHVLGTSTFREETATLPVETFADGIELPENEIVGVKMYDLGGEIVYRPALILVQLSNEATTTQLAKIAEIAGIGLKAGAGALLSLGVEASMTARVLLWADRAAFLVGTMSSAIKEHRGEIRKHYGHAGARFIRCVDYLQSATAIYGFARVALTMGKLINGLRTVSRELLAASLSGEGAAQEAVQQATSGVEEVIRQAQDIQGARAPDAAPPQEDGTPTEGGTPDGQAPAVDTAEGPASGDAELLPSEDGPSARDSSEGLESGRPGKPRQRKLSPEADEEGDAQVQRSKKTGPRLARVPYGAGALSRLAQTMRVAIGLRRGGNVAVFEFEQIPAEFEPILRRLGGRNFQMDGNRIAFQNVEGSAHSEQLAHELITAGRKAGIGLAVRRIYTEYSPCTQTCLPLIRRQYPSAEVTYSFVWERWGRQAPDRNAAVDKLFGPAAQAEQPVGADSGGPAPEETAKS
jgi:hypothetical protein